MTTLITPVYSFENFDIKVNDEFNSIPETFVETKEDLLLIACTLFRLTKQDRDKYSCYSLDIDSREIESNITQNDRIFAEKVRNDFASKLVMFVIKVGELSKFKRDVNTYLTTNFKTEKGEYSTPNKFVGLCYKLPYFYDYDQRQLKLFENQAKTVTGHLENFKDTLEVKFLTKLEPKTRKNNNTIEYWFEDSLKNKIVVNMDKNNPLISFLEVCLDKPLMLSAKFMKRIHYSVEYYVTSSWKLSL